MKTEIKTSFTGVFNTTCSPPVFNYYEKLMDRLEVRILFGLIMGILCCVTTIGNICVIYRYRRTSSVGNLFIISLAIADLIVGSFVMPLATVYTITEIWTLSLPVCQIWLSADYTASTSSILNLLTLSLDRYWSITSPLKYLSKRTKTRALFMISLAWSISVLWVFPIIGWSYLFNNGVRTVPEDKCNTEYEKNFIFKILTAICNFYIPLLTMILINTKIYLVIRKRYANPLMNPNADLKSLSSEKMRKITTGKRKSLSDIVQSSSRLGGQPTTDSDHSTTFCWCLTRKRRNSHENEFDLNKINRQEIDGSENLLRCAGSNTSNKQCKRLSIAEQKRSRSDRFFNLFSMDSSSNKNSNSSKRVSISYQMNCNNNTNNTSSGNATKNPSNLIEHNCSFKYARRINNELGMSSTFVARTQERAVSKRFSAQFIKLPDDSIRICRLILHSNVLDENDSGTFKLSNLATDSTTNLDEICHISPIYTSSKQFDYKNNNKSNENSFHIDENENAMVVGASIVVVETDLEVNDSNNEGKCNNGELIKKNELTVSKESEENNETSNDGEHDSYSDKNKSRSLNTMSEKSNMRSNSYVGGLGVNVSAGNNSNKGFMNKQEKAFKQLAAIVIGFTICFLPYFIVFLIVALCEECISERVFMTTVWLGYLNSTINPFLYALSNKTYIKSLRKRKLVVGNNVVKRV